MKTNKRAWLSWPILVAAVVGIIIITAIGFILFTGDGSLGVAEVPEQLDQSEVAHPSLSVDDGSPSPEITWMLGTIVFLSIATAISVSVSFYLYRWRRILLAQPNTLVPEKWGKYLDKVGRSVRSMSEVVEQGMRLVVHETRANSEQGSKLVETFLTLQKAIDERDEEVKRLKRGYDAELFRRFLNRFIRVDQWVRDYLDESDDEDDRLNQVQRLLEDALDECGVEIFEPPTGEDSRGVAGIADNPRTIVTDDEESDFHIVEVIEPGYRLIGTEGDQVIIPAKVRISVYENQG